MCHSELFSTLFPPLKKKLKVKGKICGIIYGTGADPGEGAYRVHDPPISEKIVFSCKIGKVSYKE